MLSLVHRKLRDWGCCLRWESLNWLRPWNEHLVLLVGRTFVLKSHVQAIRSSGRNGGWRLVVLVFAAMVGVLGTLFLEVGCCVVDPIRQQQAFRADIEPELRELCEQHGQAIPGIMESQRIPGISLALVDRGGTLWSAGFGFTDWDRKTPVTADTNFLICSTSKTFTALAALCAARDGLIDLDAPITTYLPDFTIHSRFELAPEEKISLRHLLQHTAGVTHEAPVGNGNRPSNGPLAAHALSVGDTWLRFPVGSKWEYSGAGYDLASYVLEVRAQRSFADYLEDELFQPIGMRSTTASRSKIESDRLRAIGHSSRHAKRIPLASDIPWAGAGGIYANANDLSRLIQLLLHWGEINGESVIDEESLMMMYTPSAHRNYGLGVYIWKRSLGHGGDGLGFSSEMIWIPEHGIGGVILINAQDLGDPHSEHRDWLHGLVRAILDGDFAKKVAGSPRRPDRLDPEVVLADSDRQVNPIALTPYKESWGRYVGNYRYVTEGWELRNYAKLAAAIGFGDTLIKVEESGGFLCVNGEPLEEHRPGLFFTASGACLDFSKGKPTWDYSEIQRVK